jgi:hopanoid C-2 methylase
MKRRILCIFPRYAPSFGTFEHAYALRGNTRAFMPPQGILVIAAAAPRDWEVRFIDENVRSATEADFTWAEAVLVSGMHVQRAAVNDINRRAHSNGRTTVLGGPSVSGCPEYYPEFDYLHIGELGDATERLFELLDADPARPARQCRLVTLERRPLTEFPLPAYELVQLEKYFIGSVQFSSGCPYQCEFCDIPALYGRAPRLKSPGQVTCELDAQLAVGLIGAVYFVDDNFIGNRKAARALVRELILWQQRNGYPLKLACEATINIAKYPDLLAMMREAFFTTVFCGIETPELAALEAMGKRHNASLPILDAVETLNAYGLEVVSGIILGLDTDTLETPDRIAEFIRRSHIPMLTVNLLQALPRTPLYERLAREDRILDDPSLESNVHFRRPYQAVVSAWKHLIAEAYSPEAVYERFAWNLAHTYPNRISLPASPARASWQNLRLGLTIMANLLLKVGIAADYRATFWRMAWPLLRQGRVEEVIHVGLVAHHLISYAREALAGRQNASNYSPRPAPAPRSAAG